MVFSAGATGLCSGTPGFLPFFVDSLASNSEALRY